jgi:hypothetical protein
MQTLIDNDAMKLSVVENPSDHVTLCFTGIGHRYGGIDVQSEEFFKSSNQATSIFIIDKQRSWGNNIDFEEVRGVVNSIANGKSINAIGNSMGGFLAILATKFIDIRNVLAFVPQYSVHKDIFPKENRWDKYVVEIKNWYFKDLNGAFNSKTNYYVLAGVGGMDDQHLELFPNGANIHKIYFRNRAFLHRVSEKLKEENILYDVIFDGFAGKSATEIIAGRLSDPGYQAFTPTSV